MKVTVCQLHDDYGAREREWQQLCAHVRSQASDLVLLPEMPFYPWFAVSRTFDPARWAAAVEAHTAWERRLTELAPAVVVATRPIDFGNERYNEGFVWERTTGIRAAHAKAYLPNEEGVWEASWYHAATPEFIPLQARDARLGFLICTELWNMEQVHLYGREQVQLLVIPRVTAGATLDKWLAAGRVAAVVSGVFALSSNRFAESGLYGGQGWIIDPDGAVLALTSAEQPFATARIDLEAVERAKTTYPRYALMDRHAHV
jgi:N-carbamoylputrescine amidase